MGTQHTLQWLLVLESWQEKTNGKLLHLDLGKALWRLAWSEETRLRALCRASGQGGRTTQVLEEVQGGGAEGHCEAKERTRRLCGWL